MESKLKKMVVGSTAILCCVIVVLCGLWCNHHSGTLPCARVNIVVQDSVERQFVGVKEIVNYLDSCGLYPQGKVLSTVDCQTLEQSLKKHEMLRTACCYKTAYNGVCMVVDQRVPVMIVFTDDSCGYYVDMERTIMPMRSKVNVRVPVFRGAVNENSAKAEYYDFAQWLSKDAYWSKKIHEVHVLAPNDLILTQTDDNATILLGSLDDYASKLDKMRVFYEKGADIVDYSQYKAYDVRYSRQVVGKK